MKILGLIGGISWVSTADYYRLINEGINTKMGGLNFSHCIIHSFNYATIKKNNDAQDWDATFSMVSDACIHLKNSGATAIVLCANTMHVIAERLENTLDIPIIHIASATAKAIQEKRIKKVGLLGTKFTMEMDFFTSKLAARDIEAIIPGEEDREFIHNTIYYELGKGLVLEGTQRRYLAIIESLVQRGADGIVLGCTEISMLVHQRDVVVPVFDTTHIHAEAAIAFSLA